MRVTLTLCALALSLAPAAVSARDFNEPALADAAGELSDPERQEQVAAMAGAMIDAVMRMPVGGMMQAAADMAGKDAGEIDPETTIADLAGDDAADAPVEVAERLPQMMGMMAQMAGAMDAMVPQLREMAETMRRELPRTD